MSGLSSIANLHRMIAEHPLARRRPVRAWLRFGWWQIQSRLRSDSSVQWIGGQRLVVRRGMTGATGNIYLGLHEFTDMMLALHALREGDLFVDIGANVGTYTVLASGVCKARTIAFEPDPKTAQALRRNLRENNLESRVTVHECALGPEQCEVAFTVGLDTVNKVLSERVVGSRIVRQERLDDVVGEEQPVMLKIDVEGYEEGVMGGAERILSNPCLKLIEIETVTPRIEDLLASHSFERYYYNPFTREISKMSNSLPANNRLYVRDVAFVEQRVASAPKLEVMGECI
jgi:FkbM family methyltransferase